MTPSEHHDLNRLLADLTTGSTSAVLDDLENDPVAQELLDRHFQDDGFETVRHAARLGHEAGRERVIERLDFGGTDDPREAHRRCLWTRPLQIAAMAAGVILAIALFLIPAGQPLALAAVIDTVGRFDSIAYETTVTTYDDDGTATVGAVSSIIQSAGFGLRKDTYDEADRPFLTEILSLTDAEWLTLIHADRSFTRTPMTPQQRAQMAVEVSPAVWIVRLTSVAESDRSESVGTERIDGRTADIFEWSYIHPGNADLRKVTRLFVDRRTGLPVRLVDESHRVDPPRLRMTQVSERFLWGEAIESDFATTVPEGYSERK